MEALVLVGVILIVVWYFGSALGSAGDTINNVLEASSDMANTQMKIYTAEHKASAIDKMSKVEIDTNKVAKAKENIDALNSIEL